MTTTHASTQCTNPELVAELTRLARSEREATVALIALLAEFDRRKLYLAEGCSSLFTYCTQVLHLSEHAAYGRIEAARAAQEFPLILQLLVQGAVNLTAIALLRPHLTMENHASLLGRARGKRKREIEELVAQLRPQPAVPSAIRKLPQPRVPSAPPLNVRQGATEVPEIDAVPMRPEVKPLAPERYKVQFTVDKDTYDELRRVQDLLRHSVPMAT